MELGHLSFPDAKKAVYALMGRDYEDAERDIVATYDYVDETGALRYQVVREFPKKFRQRHKVGGNWVWNLRGCTPLPYNLPAIAKSQFCMIVEGEGDVECLRSHGIVASCNSGGAGNWKPELNACFAGKRLLLVPDNDEKGRDHVLKVAAMLAPTASRLQILELPDLPEKGDIRDWFTRGGSVDALRELANTKARDWLEGFSFAPKPSAEDQWVQSPGQIVVAAGGMEKAWDLVGEAGIPTPWEYLDDLVGGLRKQEVYFIAGRRGDGKTSMLLQFIMNALEQDYGVLMFSLEMRAIDVLHRMVSMHEMIDLAQVRALQKKRRKNTITLEDSELLASLVNRASRTTAAFEHLPLLVHTKSVVTPEYIVEEAHRLVKQQKIDLIVADHMQLVSSSGNEKTDYEKFTAISRAFKRDVAKELNLPLLAASQVSRKHTTQGEKGADRAELEITDLRASGALEEDAAWIGLLYHDVDDAKAAKLNGRSSKGPVKAWLKSGKNRFGPSPVYMAMSHLKKYTQFLYTPEHDPQERESYVA
jgi:KaiC/GvpD/RAD55 family RecA-like ATPase